MYYTPVVVFSVEMHSLAEDVTISPVFVALCQSIASWLQAEPDFLLLLMFIPSVWERTEAKGSSSWWWSQQMDWTPGMGAVLLGYIGYMCCVIWRHICAIFFSPQQTRPNADLMTCPSEIMAWCYTNMGTNCPLATSSGERCSVHFLQLQSVASSFLSFFLGLSGAVT